MRFDNTDHARYVSHGGSSSPADHLGLLQPVQFLELLEKAGSESGHLKEILPVLLPAQVK